MRAQFIEAADLEKDKKEENPDQYYDAWKKIVGCQYVPNMNIFISYAHFTISKINWIFIAVLSFPADSVNEESRGK